MSPNLSPRRRTHASARVVADTHLDAPSPAVAHTRPHAQQVGCSPAVFLAAEAPPVLEERASCDECPPPELL